MKIRLIAVGVAAMFMVAGCKDEAKQKEDAVKIAPAVNTVAQTTCPVMGGKIDKKQFVDVKGYRIYVCCAGCTGLIKKDPDKYIKILQDQGVNIEKAPQK